MKAVLIAAVGAALSSPAIAQPPPEALPGILRLQLDQRAAWRAYKDALAESRAEASHAQAETARLNGLTTPERLAALRGRLKAQDADFERQAEATEAFYAALSPDQRTTFDAVTRAPVAPAPMHAYPQATDSTLPAPLGARTLQSPPPGTGLPPPAP